MLIGYCCDYTNNYHIGWADKHDEREIYLVKFPKAFKVSSYEADTTNYNISIVDLDRLVERNELGTNLVVGVYSIELD